MSVDRTPPVVVPAPSNEQQIAIETFGRGCNLVVQAVAGAGKTTLMLQICEANPTKRVQIVTYNASLKHEGRLKIKQLGLQSRVRVDTFHSLASRAYGISVPTDEALIKLLGAIAGSSDVVDTGRLAIKKWYWGVDVLMVDEAQDITPVLWKLLMCVIRDISTCGGANTTHTSDPGLQLVVVGDERQMINGYRNADARYLSLAPFIFPTSGRLWAPLCLSTSYRLTPTTAAFVNTVMLGENKVVGGNTTDESVPVVYWPVRSEDISKLIREVEHHLKDGSTVAFLAHSTKFSLLAQELVKIMDKTAFFIASDSTTRVASNSRLLLNKIHILTYHASKGLEFDYVYQISTTTKHNQDDVSTCGNVEYVASTRARKQLVVIEYRKPFRAVSSYPRLLATHSLWHPDFIVAKGVPFKTTATPLYGLGQSASYRPSTMSDFMAPEILTGLVESYLCVSEVRGAMDEAACLSYSTEQSFTFGDCVVTEDVSFLYGMVIPMVVEWKRLRHLGLLEWNCAYLNSEKGRTEFREGNIVRDTIYKRDDIKNELMASYGFMTREKVNEALFYLANFCNATLTSYPHLLRQILHYSWIEHSTVDRGVVCLETEIGHASVASSTGIFEKELMYHGVPRSSGVPTINGAADYVISTPREDIVYEFKFTATLGIEHVLQTATYVAMHTLAEASNHDVTVLPPAGVTGRLFNIRTGQLTEVRVADPVAFLEAFITAKVNTGSTRISDATFIEACKFEDSFYECDVNTGCDNDDDIIDFMDVNNVNDKTIPMENSERGVPLFSF